MPAYPGCHGKEAFKRVSSSTEVNNCVTSILVCADCQLQQLGVWLSSDGMCMMYVINNCIADLRRFNFNALKKVTSFNVIYVRVLC